MGMDSWQSSTMHVLHWNKKRECFSLSPVITGKARRNINLRCAHSSLSLFQQKDKVKCSFHSTFSIPSKRQWNTEPYFSFCRPNQREGFGCSKQQEVQVQHTQCARRANFTGKANAKASGTANTTDKKRNSASPPPTFTGKASGTVRVSTHCPTWDRALLK